MLEIIAIEMSMSIIVTTLRYSTV